MRFPTARRTATTLSGVVGTVRSGRRTSSLLPRLKPGDVAVIDHLDLDQVTARSLVDAGVVAVVDAAPIISGRYPNLGPRVLAEAGVVVVDGVGAEGFAALADGRKVRVHDGQVHASFAAPEDGPLATGRGLDLDAVEAEMARAREGLSVQVEAFTHNTTEFLRREHDLLLNGVGLPDLTTPLSGRPSVVVGAADGLDAALRRIRPYLDEQQPAVVAVDECADLARRAGVRTDVVVISSAAASLPEPATLRAARDVVLVGRHEGGSDHDETLARLGVTPVRVETTAGATDVALLLASHHDSSLIVGVGVHLGLEELLDRQRGGLASGFLTRLEVGGTLVDASALPVVYAGRLRVLHLLLVVLAGLVAVVAAVAVTPVGQEWFDQLGAWAGDQYSRIRGAL